MPHAAPLVVTVHDLAFVHDPAKFSRHGVRTMRRSLDPSSARGPGDLLEQATRRDCEAAGIPADRLRLVPLGVEIVEVTAAEVERVRRRYLLPDEFVLFVGTVEPRKNLAPSGRGGAPSGHAAPARRRRGRGLGRHGAVDHGDTLFLGFVPDEDLAPLYAAATVFGYPSEREGFGLPVLEAMAQGARW